MVILCFYHSKTLAKYLIKFEVVLIPPMLTLLDLFAVQNSKLYDIWKLAFANNQQFTMVFIYGCWLVSNPSRAL